MKITDFKDKSFDEMTALLDKEFNEFDEKVKTITNVEELEKLENDIDKEQEEFDEYLRAVEYELSQEPLEFEGKTYKVRDITTKIVHHLNRTEAEFQYCLGLHGLVVLWKKYDVTKINYGAYDSTLRLLGQLKFKGDSEWTDILIINNYLSTCHEPYKKDRAFMVSLAQKRNAVSDRIQMISPVKSGEEIG